MKKLFTLLTLLVAIVTGAKAAGYTPDADEVIILNEVYDANKADAGYSTHAAVAWGGTASTNSKKTGDPYNNGEPTSGNVNGYQVKGNGKGKNITISVTGVSKIIIYHEKHSSRYVELRDETKDGDLIGKGAANTYFTEVELNHATDYTLFLHGTTGTDDQDLVVYAVKLIKYVPEGPTITTDLADASYMTGGTNEPLTVEATPSAGTLSYQWYKCDDKDKTNAAEISGATTASYTPTEAGFYYVKVTDDNGPVESSVAQVTFSAASAPEITGFSVDGETVADTFHRIAGWEPAVSVTVTGTPTPDVAWKLVNKSDDSEVKTGTGTDFTYKFETEGNFKLIATASNGQGEDVVKEFTINIYDIRPVTFSPNGSYFEESQKVILSTETPGSYKIYYSLDGENYSEYADPFTVTETTTVTAYVIKAGIDGEKTTATFTKVTLAEQTSISEAKTWDFSKYGTKEIGTNGTPFYRNDVLVANVAQYGKAAAAADFGPATALVLNGDYIVRDSKFCQVTHAKFKTTVPGTLKVVFSNTGSDTRPYRYLYVNGVKTEYASNTSKSNTTAEGIQVNSGEVDLYGVLDPEADDKDAGQVTFIRIYSIEFTPLSAETLILGEQGGNADKISAAAGTTKNVFVDRKISNEYYNTLFLPFELTTAQISTIFGEGTKVAKYKGLKSNGTTFLFENVDAMEANVGYLVKPANTVNGFSVEGAAIVNAGDISVTDFTMLGTYDTFGNKAGNIVYYFTTEGKMKKLSDTGKIKGLRAMLAKIQNGAKNVSTVASNVDLNPVISGGTEVGRARDEYFVEFVDDAAVVTAIEAIDNSQLTIDDDAPAYNLAGQKVGKGYKGIVIKNGKKYVVK